jgi:peptide/nickel transport system ATP-binding protein
LDLQAVEFSYASGVHAAALRDITFALHRGERVGVIGASGAGKSTLARLVAGLEAPTRGVVGRHPAIPASGGTFAHMVFQDPASSLDPQMTVLECLAEAGRNPPGGDKTAAEPAAWLDVVGLPRAIADRRPTTLSGGQRQRVAIARALASRPAILVADEPTTALDSDATVEVLGALERTLAQDPELAVLLVTHDLDLVAAVCERVLVLDAGRLVEIGSTFDVLSAPQSAAAQRLTAAWRALATRPLRSSRRGGAAVPGRDRSLPA